MTVVCCGACGSDLVEKDNKRELICISCGNEFDIADGIAKEIEMGELCKRLTEIHTNIKVRR